MAIPGDAVYRGKITVQNAKVSGSSDHSNFPVLLTEDNFWSELMDAGSESATNGGGGLRFSSDAAGSNQIAHEVVSFVISATESSRKAEVWVKIPTLSYSANTEIHVWSSPTASEEVASSTHGSEAVWATQKAVFHGGHLTDSSGNCDDLAGKAGGSQSWSPSGGGLFSGYFRIPGSTSGLTAANHPDYLYSDVVVLTAWVKPTNLGFENFAHIALLDNNASDGVGMIVDDSDAVAARTVGGNTLANVTGDDKLTLNTWHKTTIVFDQTANTLTHYLDGVKQTVVTGYTDNSQQLNAILYIGSDSGNTPLFGDYAEVRSSYSSITDEWEATEYNNQSDPSTFAIAGAFQTGGGTAVTPASASQPQSVSSPTLTQHNVLAVDSVSQSQAASQPTLSTGATLLVNPVDQAQTATQPALTQHNTLPVNSATQAQTATAATLTQHHILLVDNAAQLQALGSPSLTQHQALTANPLSQAQTASEPTLTQAHILAVAGLTQTQTATAVTLAVAGVLSPAPLTQAQTASVATLIQAGVLGVDALVQSQTFTEPALLTKYTLIVDALAQPQALEQSTLSIADVLAAAGLTQTQSAGNVTLITADGLAVDALTQAQSAGAVALTEHGVLAVDSLTQAQLLSISQNAVVLGWLDGTLVITAALGGTLTINPAR